MPAGSIKRSTAFRANFRHEVPISCNSPSLQRIAGSAFFGKPFCINKSWFLRRAVPTGAFGRRQVAPPWQPVQIRLRSARRLSCSILKTCIRKRQRANPGRMAILSQIRARAARCLTARSRGVAARASATTAPCFGLVPARSWPSPPTFPSPAATFASIGILRNPSVTAPWLAASAIWQPWALVRSPHFCPWAFPRELSLATSGARPGSPAFSMACFALAEPPKLRWPAATWRNHRSRSPTLSSWCRSPRQSPAPLRRPPRRPALRHRRPRRSRSRAL